MFRPLEPSAIQTAIIEPEPVEVPVKYLELVAIVVAEDEEAAAEYIQIEAVLYYCGKAVYRFTKIGVATGKVDGRTLPRRIEGSAAQG